MIQYVLRKLTHDYQGVVTIFPPARGQRLYGTLISILFEWIICLYEFLPKWNTKDVLKQ